MLQIGKFYMHKKSMDVAVKVVADYGNLFYEVEWWTLGCEGKPWQAPTQNSVVYMHPDVWRDITELLHKPRPWDQQK